MISQLLLKFGRAPNSPAQPIDLVPITVFVGPNNSGKSKILSEIEYFCSTGQRNSSDLLLEWMAFSGLTRDAALLAIEQIKSEPTLGEPVAVDHVIIASRHGRQQYPYSQLISF
jgi:ABC-type cobalamin/Fe3+-siderophores transport system ATPase subunit